MRYLLHLFLFQYYGNVEMEPSGNVVHVMVTVFAGVSERAVWKIHRCHIRDEFKLDEVRKALLTYAVLSCLLFKEIDLYHFVFVGTFPSLTDLSLLISLTLLLLTAPPDPLRYVNCARNEREQNLVAFQYQGGILYRCSQPIEPGQELLMWYEEDYAKDVTFDYLWNKKCSENS